MAGPDEVPSGILLFAMGVLKPYRSVLRQVELALPLVFGEHVASYIEASRQRDVHMKRVRLYAQTERPKGGIGRVMSRVGFHDTHIVTGDGYPLWVLEVEIRGPDSPLADRGRLRQVLTQTLRRR